MRLAASHGCNRQRFSRALAIATTFGALIVLVSATPANAGSQFLRPFRSAAGGDLYRVGGLRGVTAVGLVGYPHRKISVRALKRHLRNGVVGISRRGYAIDPSALGSRSRRHARRSPGLALHRGSRRGSKRDVRITSGPASGSTTTATTATFRFTSSTSGVGFRCSLDSRTLRSCKSPTTYSSLSPRRHTFTVEAIKSSRAAVRASRTWTVVAPSTQGTGTGAGSGTGTGSPTGTGAPKGPQTSWASPGTLPMADSAAAALVTHEPEIRPDNTAANNYVPSDSELQAVRNATTNYFNPLIQYVTGRDGLTNPSTDDLIQWAAHKWGIPEDWIRAEAVTETHWHQNYLGDLTGVSSQDYSQFPPQSQAGNNQVYESLGLMQLRWNPEGLHAGSEPLRWKSTAFNLDYYGAEVRYFYDGRCNWCGPGYSAGQDWNSIGAWYNPSPWGSSGGYIQSVQGNLANRTWAQPGF